MVAEDVANNRFGRPIKTRFPPEPNGFPHIGHVKAITVSFGIAKEFGGTCILHMQRTLGRFIPRKASRIPSRREEPAVFRPALSARRGG